MPAVEFKMEETLTQLFKNNSQPAPTARPSEVLIWAEQRKCGQDAQEVATTAAIDNSNLNRRTSSQNSIYNQSNNISNNETGPNRNGSSSSDSSNSSNDSSNSEAAKYGIAFRPYTSANASTSTTPSALNTPDNNSTVPFLKKSLSAILDLSDEQADAIVHPLDSSSVFLALTPVLENLERDGWNIDPHSDQPVVQPLEAPKIGSMHQADYLKNQETPCASSQEPSQARIMPPQQSGQLHSCQLSTYCNQTSSSPPQQANALFACTNSSNPTHIVSNAHPQSSRLYPYLEEQRLNDLLNCAHSNSSPTDSYPFSPTNAVPPLPTQIGNGTTASTNNNFGSLLSINQDYLHTNLTPMLSSTAITATSEVAAVPAASPLPLPPTTISASTTNYNHIASAPPSIPNSTLNTPVAMETMSGFVTSPMTHYFTQRHDNLPNHNSTNSNVQSNATALAPKPSVSYQHLPFAMTPINRSHTSGFISQPVNISANNAIRRSHSSDNCIFNPHHYNSSKKALIQQRRTSSGSDQPSISHHPPRTYGRRASSHPSVASVVSLTAHEPVSKIIDGIEYISFLYSHDRLVKHYTVRTDINSVNLDDISMDFRIQNAIYPRANVDKSEYDGNRWEYETTCNQLGWKLCWLNKDQLFGRRGLIQRAVDSYRNRHAEMRSRRVTRQEKVANGTLRKRRSKKFLSQDALLH